ncbi:MAG: STAS domain-containing protein [Ruminococcus sp.]|nr:STAS domain-containing protein [Candidatus Copronaster equi]
MTITKTVEEKKITLKLDGWLDTISSPLLGEEIDKITEAESIILDFDKVEYMASSGLRQVVYCHKKTKEINAELSIINVGAEVMDIFALTGIDKKLNISTK